MHCRTKDRQTDGRADRHRTAECKKEEKVLGIALKNALKTNVLEKYVENLQLSENMCGKLSEHIG